MMAVVAEVHPRGRISAEWGALYLSLRPNLTRALRGMPRTDGRVRVGRIVARKTRARIGEVVGDLAGRCAQTA